MKLAYAAFDLVATGYCFCNQDRFGEDRTEEEKELFGKLAGLNIKMAFSHRYSKDIRDRLKDEARDVVQMHQTLVESKPDWLKTIKKEFRTCHKQQQISSRLFKGR